MKRKLTSANLALWAALPMAQTSKIESRLTLILDTKTRRTLPRRALVLAVSLGGAALIPLAMLRPTAKAQTAPAVTDTQFIGSTSIQLVGVRDVNVHHTDSRWWSSSGQILLKPVSATESFQINKDLYSSTDVKNLCFAFRPSAIAAGETIAFLPSNASRAYYTDYKTRPWRLTASFPLPQKTATVQVGIAARPWSMAATHAPVRRANAGISSTYGKVTFSPIEHFPRSDWIVTVTIDQPKRDPPKQDWRIVAVNAHGQKVYPISDGTSSTPTQLHIYAYFSKPVSSHHIRQFQVETRPFVWTEFKNVALQPSK